MANVTIYSIHGSYGIWRLCQIRRKTRRWKHGTQWTKHELQRQVPHSKCWLNGSEMSQATFRLTYGRSCWPAVRYCKVKPGNAIGRWWLCGFSEVQNMESHDSKRNIEVAKKGITPARIYHGSKDGIFSAYHQFWSECQGVHNATIHGRLVHLSSTRFGQQWFCEYYATEVVHIHHHLVDLNFRLLPQAAKTNAAVVNPPSLKSYMRMAGCLVAVVMTNRWGRYMKTTPRKSTERDCNMIPVLLFSLAIQTVDTNYKLVYKTPLTSINSG